MLRLSASRNNPAFGRERKCPSGLGIFRCACFFLALACPTTKRFPSDFVSAAEERNNLLSQFTARCVSEEGPPWFRVTGLTGVDKANGCWGVPVFRAWRCLVQLRRQKNAARLVPALRCLGRTWIEGQGYSRLLLDSYLDLLLSRSGLCLSEDPGAGVGSNLG